METDREAVLKIHPDAYLNEDYSGAPSADVAVFRKATKEDWPNNREVQIGNFCGSNEAAWKSAHSRLLVNTPAPHPDLPHQADGDDFPEPHMGVQPEPEDSPELAQAVAPGERKQGHSALRLDKDAQKISMFDPHPKQEPDNDLLNSICREMFECSYANLTDPIKCDMVIRSYLQVSKPCADDPHWDYCKWGENCNCGHPLIDHVPGKTCLGCGNSIYACKEFKLRGWVAFKGEPETTDAIKLRIAMRELKATRDNNAQLRSQLRNWETWGTVEIAIRNPNVDSYMKHWEGRALAAEEKVVELEGRIANALL